MRRRRRTSSIVGVFAVLAIATGAAGAAPTASDVALNIGAAQTNARPVLVPSGQTVTVASKSFYVFLDLSLVSNVPAQAVARVELGGGLQWGPDAPDAGEHCTATATTGECDSGDLQPIAGGNSAGWRWDVLAPGNGTYTFKGDIVRSADADPDTSNDSSQITIVVNETAGGGGGGGGGSTRAVTAGAVKVSPARPIAGSTVIASVRVTRGASAVRPTGIACSASLGAVKVKGGAKSASGLASCRFKTPKSASGKSLVGSISFRAGGSSFTKRFAVRLR